MRTREQILEYNKKYYEKNKSKFIKYSQEYYKNNKDKRKKYIKNNKEKIKETDKKYRKRVYKQRVKNNTNYKISKNLRTRMRHAIKQNWKSGSTIKDLGCSIEKFILWIEMQWQDGMNWDNYGVNGWHIDHKIPLANFDLSDRNQFLQACNYTNLQPLWAKENLSKGDKFDYN